MTGMSRHVEMRDSCFSTLVAIVFNQFVTSNGKTMVLNLDRYVVNSLGVGLLLLLLLWLSQPPL